MSQEERDARLGLTGLTGAEREARLRLLREQVEREAAAARAALQLRRKYRSAAAGASALAHAAGAEGRAQAGAEGRAAEGSYTRTLEAFWAAAKRSAGDREGTRLLVEVLSLRRELPAHALVAGINAALKIGSVSTDLVAAEARKAFEDTEHTGMDTCVAAHEDE
ncbi:hypothetical protein [Streptomyces sp. MMG1533]|uniref:hypothetical protein n=1 Tax=Streptomyces sp. MMG1533 TaxID=1415546 RepID=UPI0006AF6CEA|nr:hypothetical protein [Streptomyces sp. MMG1533]